MSTEMTTALDAVIEIANQAEVSIFVPDIDT